LQRSQDFADHRAAAVERFSNASLVLVERLEALLRRLDLGLDSTQARRGVYQVLIEFRTVGTDLVNFAFERGFRFGGLALLVARGFEIVIPLLQNLQRIRIFTLAGRG
jgi:hypothetical protein